MCFRKILQGSIYAKYRHRKFKYKDRRKVLKMSIVVELYNNDDCSDKPVFKGELDKNQIYSEVDPAFLGIPSLFSIGSVIIKKIGNAVHHFKIVSVNIESTHDEKKFSIFRIIVKGVFIKGEAIKDKAEKHI